MMNLKRNRNCARRAPPTPAGSIQHQTSSLFDFLLAAFLFRRHFRSQVSSLSFILAQFRATHPTLVAPKPRVGGSRFTLQPFNASTRLGKLRNEPNSRTAHPPSNQHFPKILRRFSWKDEPNFAPIFQGHGTACPRPCWGADLPRQVARHTRQCVYRKSFVVIPKTLN